jgi:hypothetical protein
VDCSSQARKWCSSIKSATPLLFALALLGAGCKRETIVVYTAPKDPEPPQQIADTREIPKAPPQLTWTLPEGWKVGTPSEVSLASFRVFGAGGKDADVSITRLGNLAGREPLLVNMWRSRVGQKEISEEEALKELHPVEVAGETGSLFEVSGEGLEETNKIVTVMLNHPDGSWFFKLAGEISVVESQKAKFLEFLKSVRITDTPAAASESVADNQMQFHWRVPNQWKPMPAGEMQVARFAVPGPNQAKADVFVSVFSTDSGGVLLNVNRWRKQVGLDPIDASGLKQLIAPLDPGKPDAILVDMANDNKRLIASIVPRDGQYWFYKLLGDAKVVGAERNSFVEFAKSEP